MSSPVVDPVANLAAVSAELKSALKETTIASEPPTIIAVSKTHDQDRILPVLESGHRVFGENRVQEAIEKWPALKERFPDTELHLIGPLQSNKAKAAVALFDVIETIDRLKIAKAIAAEMKQQGRKLRLLVQVNIGEESQKTGVLPVDVDGFISQCREELGLEIAGLMCIPPVEDNPAPYFALLSKMAARNNLDIVSMGMSGDYTMAVQLGATHVRVGSAIFGPRMVK